MYFCIRGDFIFLSLAWKKEESSRFTAQNCAKTPLFSSSSRVSRAEFFIYVRLFPDECSFCFVLTTPLSHNINKNSTPSLVEIPHPLPTKKNHWWQNDELSTRYKISDDWGCCQLSAGWVMMGDMSCFDSHFLQSVWFPVTVTAIV